MVLAMRHLFAAMSCLFIGSLWFLSILSLDRLVKQKLLCFISTPEVILFLLNVRMISSFAHVESRSMKVWYLPTENEGEARLTDRSVDFLSAFSQANEYFDFFFFLGGVHVHDS